MIRSLLFAVLGAFALTCNGAESRVLDGTLSPDKRTVIIEEDDAEGRSYFFARQSDHKKLGHVLPRDQRHQISNVAIIASWNHRATNVALLVFYGTKLSELLLFTRDAQGKFQPVTWRRPDAEATYRQRTGRTIPRPGDGYDENAVGPWVDDDTVRLISGQAIQTEDQDHYTHLLVPFKACVRDRRAAITDLQIEGPFSDQTDEKFIKRWGHHYFSDGD